MADRGKASEGAPADLTAGAGLAAVALAFLGQPEVAVAILIAAGLAAALAAARPKSVPARARRPTAGRGDKG